MPINPDILDVLACPVCKGKLKYNKDTQELLCRFDKLVFPIKNGVPIFYAHSSKKCSITMML